MTEALNLTVRNPIEVMRIVTAFFANEPDAQISFEGDISAVDWGVIPGATAPENSNIAIVPLTMATANTLMRSVYPRIGLRSRIWHITLQQHERRLFASYDNFGEGMVVIEAPQRALLFAELNAAGLVVASRVVKIADSTHEPSA